jgi:two-component system cell cycle sensor histidine kinase/response regulator CckA
MTAQDTVSRGEEPFEANLARKAIDRSAATERGGSVVLVLLVAGMLVAAATAIVVLGRSNAEPYILAFLAVLATVGVFSLFALACGILRLSATAEVSPLIKSVVDSAFDGVVVTDADGRVVYANAAYLDLIEASDLNDMRPVERVFIGDADASEAIYRLLKAAREGKRAQEVVRIAGIKGRPPRWLHFKIRPLGDGRRQARLTVWSLADVSRERERQENVFQELQHAIDYLDHAPAGFFSVDAKGDVVYLNATLANWLDQDLAQVGSGGLKLADLIWGDGAALLTTLQGAPGEVKTEVLDLDLRTRGSRTLPVRLFHKLAFGADGAPGASRTLVLNRAKDDGTDPQRAADIRFMRFFHHTPMAIATIDKQGGVIRTNPQFEHLFHGTRSAEGEDRSIRATVAERDWSALEAAIRAAAAGKADIAPVDAMLAGPGERFGRFYVTAVKEADRDQEAAIVYALETTAQREFETKVTQTQKMELVGQLAGGIAHDFNNVLSAIMMATDFLLNAHKPTDPSFQDIMQIKQNANRAASLVRHLLAFSRKQTMRPQVLDLGEVLSDLNMLLRRLIGEKVTLQVVHGRDLWPVRVDISQFEQVIVNLAVNARDAMPGGGRLELRTANVTAKDCERFHAKGMPAADYVLVEVSDSGTGIPAAIVDKIFEPFFSTKEVGKGTADRRLRLRRFGRGQRHDVPHFPAAAHCQRPRRGAGTRCRGPGLIADRRACGGRGGQAAGQRRPHRRRHHPSGRGRGRLAGAQRPRPDVARLYRARSRQRRRGDRCPGEDRRPGRSRGVRRGDAGNGRTDLAARTAQPRSQPEDHLRLRLCRRCFPEAPACRRPAICVPGKTLHAEAACCGGEGDHGGLSAGRITDASTTASANRSRRELSGSEISRPAPAAFSG